MRRTIKFRAKTTANGHWVYGSLINYGDGTFAIRNRGSEPWVQADTVGQLTGLLDRNGKEIYEGDILAYESFIGELDYCSIIYLDGAFCLNGDYGPVPLCEQNMKEYEIIGNIHEQ